MTIVSPDNRNMNLTGTCPDDVKNMMTILVKGQVLEGLGREARIE